MRNYWKTAEDLPEAIRHHVDELLKCRIDGRLLCELFEISLRCEKCALVVSSSQ